MSEREDEDQAAVLVAHIAKLLERARVLREKSERLIKQASNLQASIDEQNVRRDESSN